LEKEKALCLQKGYKTKCCPICLDSFDYGDDEEKAISINGDDNGIIKKQHKRDESLDITLNDDEYSHSLDQHTLLDDSLRTTTSTTITTMMMLTTGRASFLSVDKYGVPIRGADGKKIKILRCGHIFCDTCWKNWVHSGCGNPCNCPVCRQDVGRTNSKSKSSNTGSSSSRRHQRVDSHSTSGGGGIVSSSPVTDVGSNDATTIPVEVSTSLLSTEDHTATAAAATNMSSLSSGGYGTLNCHTRDESFDGLLSATDSISVEESVLGSSMNISRSNRNGMSLDMPLVGGGASFLLYHHMTTPCSTNVTNSNCTNNNNSNNNNNNTNSSEALQDGESTPLLFTSRNSNN
jgi:Prokaryotic RING finger family 4